VKAYSFEDEDISTLRDALAIAEDEIGDFYKFSFAQWRRHHYDVKTLSSLKGNEIVANAFALLNKGSRIIRGFESKTKKRDFYYICLQDHQILKALRSDNNLQLLSLLVYILTHELVHIVRFCNFLERFEITGNDRIKEEKIVHKTTFDILEDLSLPQLGYVLDSYRDQRICESAFS